MNTQHTRRRNSQTGFTLIEMLVATALFVVVMLVSVNTLIALVQANRKAQGLQSVVNNLNVALDGMQRSISAGSYYHCGSSYSTPLTTQDCKVTPSDTFAFEPFGKPPANPPTVYRLHSGRLEKSVNGSPFLAITAPEVSIDSMDFYVAGSQVGSADLATCLLPCDTYQPKVVAIIQGTAPIQGGSARSTFHIQMTITQRLLDI